MITVSLVTHGHGNMVSNLVEQLRTFSSVRQIILTVNIAESLEHKCDDLVQVIQNSQPIGFGANHNNAFYFCNQQYFCVLNPDIVFLEDPFPYLLNCLQQFNIALAAPIILSSSGDIEDSARKFPTFYSLLKKFLFSIDGKWPLEHDKNINYPDWVAGMFMLFDSKKFNDIKGFDTRYFLYYEDVDICRRIKLAGYSLGLCIQAKVIHNARRTSRKNIKYMFWHIRSIFRFLFL